MTTARELLEVMRESGQVIDADMSSFLELTPDERVELIYRMMVNLAAGQVATNEALAKLIAGLSAPGSR